MSKETDLINIIKQAVNEKTSAYDTNAEVVRVEDGVIWAKFAGGVEETPIEKTINAKVGDQIKVRVAGGRAWAQGNASAPPTDDTRANEAKNTANNAVVMSTIAQKAAESAVESAEVANVAAAEATATAESVHDIAVQAQTDATEVKQNLQSVVQGATTVEKAVSVMQTAMEAIIDYDPNTTQETFSGDGSETDFALQTEATDILAVTVDGETVEYTTAVVSDVTVVTIDPAPADESEISITYEHATTQEWFWHDANGAHVLGDESGYRNDIKSTGMDVVEVANEKSVAEFGASGARIGQTDESHLEMDYHSMQLIDKEGDTYFYISDLRDEQGYATFTESFTGNGTSYSFEVQYDISEIVSATDSSDPTNYARGIAPFDRKLFYMTRPPANGATVTIVYKTVDEKVKCFTLGTRDENGLVGPNSYAFGENVTASGLYSHAEGWGTAANGQASHSEGNACLASGREAHAEGGGCSARGDWSHAEGNNTSARGTYSHAQNQGTIAKGGNQTALGRYNIEDTNDDYALIIGNGTSNNNRSNALDVDWSGNVEADGDITDGSGNVLADKADTAMFADYVVEQGTSGIWAYRKWNSGIAECWGYYEKTITITASGNTAMSPPAMPSIFTSAPIVTTSGGGYANPGIFCTYVKVYSTSGTYGIDCYLRNQGTSAFNNLGWVNMQAIGRWK